MYRFLNFRYSFVHKFTEFIDFLSTYSCQGLWFVLRLKTKTFTSCIEELKIGGGGATKPLNCHLITYLSCLGELLTSILSTWLRTCAKTEIDTLSEAKLVQKKLIYFRLLGIFSETLWQHINYFAFYCFIDFKQAIFIS